MKTVLMGIPVVIPPELNMPPWTPYKSSIQVAADCCGRLVWQGPEQQQKKLEHPDWPIWCALCVVKESLAAGKDPHELNVIPLNLFKKAGE